MGPTQVPITTTCIYFVSSSYDKVNTCFSSHIDSGWLFVHAMFRGRAAVAVLLEDTFHLLIPTLTLNTKISLIIHKFLFNYRMIVVHPGGTFC